MARKRDASRDSQPCQLTVAKRDKPAAAVAVTTVADPSGHQLSWTYDQDSRVYVGLYRGGGQPNARIAAFDFDGEKADLSRRVQGSGAIA